MAGLIPIRFIQSPIEWNVRLHCYSTVVPQRTRLNPDHALHFQLDMDLNLHWHWNLVAPRFIVWKNIWKSYGKSSNVSLIRITIIFYTYWTFGASYHLPFQMVHWISLVPFCNINAGILKQLFYSSNLLLTFTRCGLFGKTRNTVVIILHSTVFPHPLVVHQLLQCVSVLRVPLQHLPY